MSDIIQDRGRGPEIAGTRITVYNLLQSFLDANSTEEEICRVYDLTGRQVAAARAYVLNNADTILAEHLKIETRMMAGNPPEVRAQAEKARSTFKRFKQWLLEKEIADRHDDTRQNGADRLPTFREWLAEHQGQ